MNAPNTKQTVTKLNWETESLEVSLDITTTYFDIG